MYTNKEKHLHVSLPYACIILPMAALALLVEHLAAERKVTGSIPRHRPILRVLNSTLCGSDDYTVHKKVVLDPVGGIKIVFSIGSFVLNALTLKYTACIVILSQLKR